MGLSCPQLFEGYLSQSEREGAYMVVFESAPKALRFAMVLQVGLAPAHPPRDCVHG
jgi:hypothetical protein